MTHKMVLCGCGAQWHGKYVMRGAENIEAHQARWPLADRGYTGDAVRPRGCARISHESFREKFTCGCAECCAERSAKRMKKRADDLAKALEKAERLLAAR